MRIVYAIFDRKTNSTCFVKDAYCIQEFERWFATTFLRSDSMFALYPDDYDIYSLCTFDEEKMTIDNQDPPYFVCSVDALFDIFKIPRPTVAQSGE